MQSVLQRRSYRSCKSILDFRTFDCRGPRSSQAIHLGIFCQNMNAHCKCRLRQQSVPTWSSVADGTNGKSEPKPIEEDWVEWIGYWNVQCFAWHKQPPCKFNKDLEVWQKLFFKIQKFEFSFDFLNDHFSVSAGFFLRCFYRPTPMEDKEIDCKLSKSRQLSLILRNQNFKIEILFLHLVTRI